MSRPAIDYDVTIQTSSHGFYYDKDGKYVNTSVDTGRALEWRMLRKQASVTTAPSHRGVHRTPTQYFSEWGKARCSPGQLYLSAPSDRRNGYIQYPDMCVNGLSRTPSGLYVPSAALWDELEIKALNKLRNQDINLGVALAEAKETEKLIVDVSTSVAKGISALPSATRAAARRYCGRFPSKVPSRYLGFMYGVNPLLNDIVGAGEALTKSLSDEGSVFQVKTRKRRTGALNWGYNIPYSPQSTKLISYSCDLKCVLRYRLLHPTLAKLSQLGLVNPLEIAWERVPYSFVVDWLVPVGSWLSALSGAFGYSFVHGFRSTFCTFEERGYVDTPNLFPQNAFATSIDVTGDYGYFSRSLYHSSPVPSPYVKSPVSAHHIAEALSLLATSFRR